MHLINPMLRGWVNYFAVGILTRAVTMVGRSGLREGGFLAYIDQLLYGSPATGPKSFGGLRFLVAAS